MELYPGRISGMYSEESARVSQRSGVLGRRAGSCERCARRSHRARTYIAYVRAAAHTTFLLYTCSFLLIDVLILFLRP